MIPVDQTTFGVPGGNCQSAALASILELPLEDVPHFASGDDHSADTMWANVAKWLELRGLYPINFLWEDIACRPSAYYLLFGQSKDGPHCVVAKGREIAHDPNPARSGLLTREQGVVLIPFDPVRPPTMPGCYDYVSRGRPPDGDVPRFLAEAKKQMDSDFEALKRSVDTAQAEWYKS